MYFKEYLNQYYLKDKILQNIKSKITPLDFIVISNIIYYITQKYQDIIFMETTEDYSDKRYGVLTFPNIIDQSQYEKIMGLENYFRNFKFFNDKRGKTFIVFLF